MAVFDAQLKMAVIASFVVCWSLPWSRGLANDVIVSTSWLQDRLSASPPSVRVIEVSWTLDREQRNIAHIPGATLWDLRQCTRPTSTCPRNNPDKRCFQKYARLLGVDDATPIVVYDRTQMYEAARGWWTLSMLYGRHNVAVLDGGFTEWTHQGLPTELGAYQQFTDTGSDGDWDAWDTWVPKHNGDRFRNMAQMITDIRTGERQIVDTRLPVNYRGDEAEPSPVTVKALIDANRTLCRRMLRGHMRSAINIPWPTVKDLDTGRLLDRDRLLEVFQTAGVDVGRPLTAVCYLGNTACLVTLAAVTLGAEDVAVYSGSWTEWAQLGDDRLTEQGDTALVHQLGRCPIQWRSPKRAFNATVMVLDRSLASSCVREDKCKFDCDE